jgi:hypothetical protein
MGLVISPAAAGTLLSVFDGSIVLFATAATLAAASLLTVAVPRRLGGVDPGSTQRDSLRTQLTAGATATPQPTTHGQHCFDGGHGGRARRPAGPGVTAVLQRDVAARPARIRPDRVGRRNALWDKHFVATSERLPRRVWVTSAVIGTTVGFSLMATLTTPAVVFAGAAL